MECGTARRLCPEEDTVVPWSDMLPGAEVTAVKTPTCGADLQEDQQEVIVWHCGKQERIVDLQIRSGKVFLINKAL
ncbi:hypothetical protein UY3_09392 [Chelonia mydas]|uniref:Uncharacterized protein n=1 Tax=Chelonia mydas TaxID=8469 RepID=M7B8E9_CHEMY|nr:hypothetical protein UY3_09392 [Chelonia mydas]